MPFSSERLSQAPVQKPFQGYTKKTLSGRLPRIPLLYDLKLFLLLGLVLHPQHACGVIAHHCLSNATTLAYTAACLFSVASHAGTL